MAEQQLLLLVGVRAVGLVQSVVRLPARHRLRVAEDVIRLGLLALAVVVVSGCGLTGATPTPPPIQVRLDTPDGVVGVFRDGAGIHFVIDGQDTGGQHPDRTAPTVDLFSLSGDTGRVYNSFVYGLAPVGAVRVELAGLAPIGGTVEDGMYILALRDKLILPTKLQWRFVSSAGVVLAEGSNITPER